LLTLAPHAFHWFSLRKTAEDVAARLAPVATEEVGVPPVLGGSGGWENVLEGAPGQKLERDGLPGYLRAQRWFGGQARPVAAGAVLDTGPLPGGGGPAFLVLLDVAFADGTRDLYFLPLAVTAGLAALRLYDELRPWVLARLGGPGGAAVLHDALAD